jgi:hypothetical protein
LKLFAILNDELHWTLSSILYSVPRSSFPNLFLKVGQLNMNSPNSNFPRLRFSGSLQKPGVLRRETEWLRNERAGKRGTLDNYPTKPALVGHAQIWKHEFIEGSKLAGIFEGKKLERCIT